MHHKLRFWVETKQIGKDQNIVSHTPRPIRTIGSLRDEKKPNISYALANLSYSFRQHLKKVFFSIMAQKHRCKHMVIVDATM